jgi:uncharacterized protein YqjF (DUF2071 family)
MNPPSPSQPRLDRAGTAHRPWPLPRGPWLMAQSWHDLLFAHWPVPVEVMRPLVPASLPLDTWEGRAWLGIVPFRMTGVRLRAVPPLPRLSAFLEVNVRTYVTLGGKPGVYFFSLDAENPLAVRAARQLFSLPYFDAEMGLEDDAGAIAYRSRRTHRGAPPAALAASYRPAGEPFRAAAGSLDAWLTERYCLYSAGPRGQVRRLEIHHQPWPLQPAQAEIPRNTLAAAAGLELPASPPLLHFARRLDVVFWPPRKVSL